jgi:hypothetical protein
MEDVGDAMGDCFGFSFVFIDRPRSEQVVLSGCGNLANEDRGNPNGSEIKEKRA